MASMHEAPGSKPESRLWRLTVRTCSCGVTAVGIVLLVRLLASWPSAPGGDHGPGGLEPFPVRAALNFLFRLPIPLHVISVGLVLQRRWLPPALARAAWVAAMVSGCWLGAALAARLFVIEGR